MTPFDMTPYAMWMWLGGALLVLLGTVVLCVWTVVHRERKQTERQQRRRNAAHMHGAAAIATDLNWQPYPQRQGVGSR